MTDTIFALSSGAPPAGIAVVRLSGPSARLAIERVGGDVPAPRRAALRVLRDASGTVLDEGLVLWFPAPASATGEDCGEFHLHGGRAVVAAVLRALGDLDGLREARPGEFTRRAFENGRLDLAEADSLADLLNAETELQRQIAQAGLSHGVSEAVRGWRERVLMLSAQVEAVLDFSDEDDVQDLPAGFDQTRSGLSAEIGDWLSRPDAERLKEGVRVAIAGPPNSGKSSLFNAIIREDAAIVSPLAGTTRDVLQRSVAVSGVPLILLDTAGIRPDAGDEIEEVGIARAQAEMARADIVLWLGPEGQGPAGAVEIQSGQDDPSRPTKSRPDFLVSSVTGSGMEALLHDVSLRARALLPKPGVAVANAHQRAFLQDAAASLRAIADEDDLLIVGEHLRACRGAFDAILGNTHTEDMLDALFGRFCIGK